MVCGYEFFTEKIAEWFVDMKKNYLLCAFIKGILW